MSRVRIPYEVAAAALGRMTEAERQAIWDLADALVDAMHERSDKVMFGRKQALETLAAVGFDMIKPTIKRAELERMEKFTTKG